MTKEYFLGKSQKSNASDLRKSIEEEEDDDQADLVNQYFKTKPSSTGNNNKRTATNDSWLFEKSEIDFEEKPDRSYEKYQSQSVASTFTQGTSSTTARFRSNKMQRPKPDLGEDYEEEPEVEGELLRSATTAPAKQVPTRILRRQEELKKESKIREEIGRKELIQQKKRERKEAEEKRLREKYWMEDILQGAKQSRDDRGKAVKIIYRKETLQEQAGKYDEGKNAYHNQFIHHPAGVSAGRFYIEPLGTKKNEENGEDSSLYFFIEQTGAEGIVLRVDKKYYELFEGDVALIPAGSVYSVANLSKTKVCVFSYVLIDIPINLEHAQEADELEQDAVLEYDYRKQGQSEV